MSRLRLRKLIAILVVLVTAVSSVALYASFTESTATQTQNVTTGQGSLDLTDGTLVQSVDSSASDLVPGDSVKRTVTLKNDATYNFSSISLTVTDSQTGQPLTSTAQGLQLTLSRCTTAYNTCSQIYQGAPTGSPLITNIQGPALTSGSADYLVATQTLVGPDPDKTLKAAAAHLVYTFQGTQRAGTSAVSTGVIDPAGTPTAGSVTPTSATLSWSPSPEATSYRVESDTSTFTTTSTSYALTGLTPGTAYHYTITALASSGASTPVGVDFTTTLATPTTFSAANVTATSADLSWDLTPGAASYKITGLSSPQTTSSNSLSLTNLNPGTLYNLSLVAISGAVTSPSATTSFTTLPSDPTGLTVTGVTSTQASLSWSATSGATSYKVTGGPSPVTTTSTSATLTGLSPATSYTITLTPYVGTTPSANPTSLTVLTTPAAPTGLAVSSITSSSFALSWTAVSGATSYTLSGAGAPQTVTTTSLTASNLTPGTTYSLSLTADNSSGSSTPATTSVITVPAAPTNFTSTNITSTTADLSWTASTGATSYTLSGGASPVTTTSTSTTLTGLTPGTDYTINLAAINASGTSSIISTSFTTTPSAPANAGASSPSSDSMFLSWDPTTGATGYEISFVTDPFTISAPQHSTTVTGLLPNTEYDFSITPLNASGAGPATHIIATTLPLTPAGFTATNVSSTGLTLSWAAVSGVSSYTVSGPQSCTTSTTSCTFTGLTPGSTAIFNLYSVGGGGASSTSTITLTVPSGTQAFTTTSIADTTVSLSWTALTGATSYQISGLSSPISTSNTTTDLTGLTPNTAYHLTLNTYFNGGSSSPVSLDFTTTTSIPTGFTASAVTPTSLHLSWDTIPGAASYAVTGAGSCTTSTTSCDITGLTPGSTPTFSLTSINASGPSAPATLSLTLPPAALTGLTVSNVTATSAHLSWDSISSTSYIISVDGNASSQSGTTFDVSGLLPNTSHTVIVKAHTAGGDGTSASASFLTLPATPTNFAVSSLTSTTAHLSWNASAPSFTIQGLASDITTTATSYDLTNLTPGTSYTLNLLAANATGATSPVSLSFLTLPAAPTNFAVSNLTSNSAHLSWSASTSATSYTLTGATSCTTATTSCDVILTPGTSYTASLIASNTSGNSPPSSLSFLTLPAAPTNLTSSSTTATSTHLSWNSVTSATSYSVTYGSTTLTTSTPSIDLTGLDASSTYNFAVAATNAAGTGATTGISVTLSPLTPTNFTVTSLASTSLTLTWDAVPGATSYALTGPLSSNVTAPAHSLAITGLTPGTAYTYTVATTNSQGTSATASLSVTTTPAAPTNFIATNITTTSAHLSWSASSGATSYSVSGPASCTTTSTSCDLTGLTPGAALTLNLSAVNSGGTSPTAVLSITLPTGSQVLTATSVTTSSLTISWNAVSGATNYHLTGGPSTIDTTATSTPITGLSPATSYTFTLVTSQGSSSTSASTLTVVTAPSDPTNFTATPTSDTSAHLAWTDSSAATYTISGSGSCVTTTNSCDISGLASASAVSFSLTASTSGGNSATVTASTTLLPQTPQNFALTNITSTTASLSWSSATGASSYKITGGATLTTSNTTSATLTGLTPGTSYTLHLTSVGTGESLPTTLTILTLPAAPANLAASSVTATSLTLTWTPSTSATSYSLTGGPTTLTTSASSLSVTGLASGTTYNFALSAINASGPSLPANLATTTLTSAPTGLYTANVTSTSADVHWDATTGATSYTLSYGSTTLPLSTNTTTITGLSPATSYTLSLTSTNASGTSGASTYTFITAPDAPTNFHLTSSTTTSAALAWNAVTGATSYTITGGPSPVTINTTSTTISGFGASGTYTLLIVANNATGSSPSTSLSITLPPTAPTGLTTSNITSSGFTFTWNAVTGAASYTVSDGTNNYSVLAPTHSYTFSGLTDGSSGSYTVSATNSGGTSSTSALTVALPPPAPTSPIASQITTSSLTLSWTASASAASYSVTGSASCTTSTTSCSFSGLTGTPSFSIVATNSGGSSSPTVFSIALPTSTQTLTLSSVTTTTASFTWNALTGATSYKITGGSQCTTTSTSCTVTGLTPSTTYTFYLTTYFNANSTASVSTSVSTVVTSPQNLAASNVTSTSLRLSWNAVSGATSYNVTGSASCSTTVNYCDITNLASGSTVTFQVTATGTSGTSDASSFTVTLVPAAPTSLVLSSITSTTATLSWTAAPGATSYKVTYNGNTPTTSGTSLALTGLSSGTSYSVSVQSISSGGNGATAGITLLTLPSAPTGLATSNVSDTSLSLSWNSVTGASTYQIYIAETGATTTTSSTSTTLTGLYGGSTYTISVTPINSSGSGTATSISVTTALTAPTALIASAVTTTSLTLDWNDVTGAATYKITGGPSTINLTAPANSTNVTGLTAGTAYTFSLTATSPQGTTAPANVVVSTLPAAANNFRASSVSSTGATFQWSAVTGATSYNVTNGTNSCTTAGTSCAVSGLTSNTTYTFSLTVTSSGGTSSPTNINITTVPPSTTQVWVTNTTSTTATVNWVASPGATSYKVVAGTTSCVSTTNLYCNLTGLTPGSVVNTYVYSLSAAGSSAGTSISVVTPVNNTTVVSTYAGNGTFYYGDNGPASAAQFSNASSLFNPVVDGSGNIYFADTGNNRIREINASTGIITTIGGVTNSTGSYPVGSSNVPATSTVLTNPRAINVDSAGNVYFSETARLRKIDTSGNLTTIAGTGTSGYSGDGGQATSAAIYSTITSIALDSSGSTLYFSDGANYRIRKIVFSTGIISTVTGNGTVVSSPATMSADGSTASTALIGNVNNIAVDSSGNLIYADANPSVLRIRKVNISADTLSTIAGNGTSTVSASSGISGTSTGVAGVQSMGIDRTNNALYFSNNSYRTRKLDMTTGLLTGYLAGNGTSGHPADGTALTSAPVALNQGNMAFYNNALYIIEYTQSYMRKLDFTSGTISTVTGQGTSTITSGVQATASPLPVGGAAATVDSSGNMYILDGANYKIRKVDTSGVITTLGITLPVDSYTFIGMAPNGDLIVNSSARIRRVTLSGTVTVIAGSGSTGYAGDGSSATAANVKLNGPMEPIFDSAGNMYFAEPSSYVVREVNTSGIISTFAGNNVYAHTGDGGQATSASVYYPRGIAFDSSGNMYIAEWADSQVRKVTPAGIISTYTTLTTIATPNDLVTDGSNFYVTSPNKIGTFSTTASAVKVLAGAGTTGYLDANGTNAMFASITEMALYSNGLYVDDTTNNRVRKITMN